MQICSLGLCFSLQELGESLLANWRNMNSFVVMESRTCLIILIISDQTTKGILGMPRIVPLVLVILGVEVPFHSIPTKDRSKVHSNWCEFRWPGSKKNGSKRRSWKRMRTLSLKHCFDSPVSLQLLCSCFSSAENPYQVLIEWAAPYVEKSLAHNHSQTIANSKLLCSVKGKPPYFRRTDFTLS